MNVVLKMADGKRVRIWSTGKIDILAEDSDDVLSTSASPDENLKFKHFCILLFGNGGM